MLVLSSEIHIGKYVFNQIVEIEVNSSYETLTDTCVVTIPRKLSFQGKSLIVKENSIFTRGDRVVVKCGYWYNNKTTIFEGFLVRVESGMPTRLHCEDIAWKLKQTQAFNLSYSKLEIGTLLKDIVPTGIEYITPGKIELGKASFKKVTAAQILSYLQDKFSIQSWCRNGKLYVGLNYFKDLQREHSFSFQRNIISDNLEYVRAEDIKIAIKAVSILPDNSKIEISAGDNEGTERTLHFYNVTDRVLLQERANIALANFKFDGFNGSFTTFGMPVVAHGDIVSLSDNLYPEKDGRYIVKSVRTTFGQGGYRQEMDIAEKV